MDIKEVVEKIMGNKELMEKVKNVDVSEIAELLKKSGIDVKDLDPAKIKAAVSGGNLDIDGLKNLAGGILGKK